MNKKVMAGLSVLLIAIIGGAVWAFSQREDPEVAKAKVAAKEIMENFNNEDTTAADRVKMIEETRKVTENLSDEQRQEGWRSMKKRMTERIDEYLEIEDEQEREAFLDREIDRWEEMGNEFSKARKDREKNEGEKAKGERSRRGGWGGPPQPGDREGNLERSRQRLDRSTPEERAKFTEYFGAIMKRRAERGKF